VQQTLDPGSDFQERPNEAMPGYVIPANDLALREPFPAEAQGSSVSWRIVAEIFGLVP